MCIILKHTLKSMWAHKGRTFILLASIALCSFAAMMSFGISGTIENAMRSASHTAFGNADIVVQASYPLGDEVTEGLPEYISTRLYISSTEFTEHIPDTYNILTKKSYTILGADADSMKKMSLVPDDMELGDMQAAIDTKLAAELGVSAGDTITLYNRRGEPYEFTVGGVYPKTKGVFAFTSSIVITADSMKKFQEYDDLTFRMMYIDILDNDRIIEARDIIEQNAPAASVDLMAGDETQQIFIGYITNVFLAMFAVLLLLVLFVTISSSQRIITDKMPVIGTFRSLGISARLTYTVLLAENALYGLTGSIIGVVLDALIRPSLVQFVVAPANSDGTIMQVDVGSASPALIIAVIIGSMLIECICPIKEILLAMKTPIRDIIFSNKDTQYRHSRVSTITGIILALAAIVLMFVPDSFIAQLTGFILTAVAAAVLFPYILRFISGLLAGLFDRMNMPIAHLAAVEVRQRKSTVGSSVLCFAASSIAIVIYIFASGFGTTYSQRTSDADVLVWTDQKSDSKIYSYIKDIDGVSDVEYIYSCSDAIEINGETDGMYSVISGFPEGGYRMYSGMGGIPEDLGDDEVVFTKAFADSCGLKTGDTVEIKFKSEMFLPLTKILTVRSTGLVCYDDSSAKTIAISEKLYKYIYKDKPQMILARSSAPGTAVSTIMNHAAGTVPDAKTAAQNDADNANDTASMMTIVNLLILFAVGMTFMGVAGNQLIGFEGRRRECAVLISSSMTRRQLAEMFLIESFTAAGISLISAVPMSLLLSGMFEKILAGMMISVPSQNSAGTVAVFGLILWAVFTAVAAFPINRLNSMNLAEQLKYE